MQVDQIFFSGEYIEERPQTKLDDIKLPEPTGLFGIDDLLNEKGELKNYSPYTPNDKEMEK